jgi:hypothetical protein
MAKAREIASRFPRPRALLDTPTADYGAAPDNTFESGPHAIHDGPQTQLVTRHDQEHPWRPTSSVPTSA